MYVHNVRTIGLPDKSIISQKEGMT